MMLAASDQPSSDMRRFTLPRRTMSFAITVLIHLLLLLLLLKLAPPHSFVPMNGGRLISINIAPEQKDAARAKSPAKAKQAAAAAAPAAPRAAPPPPVPAPVPTQSVPDYPLIKLTHDEMASLDTTLNTRRAAPAQASADSEGSGAGDAAKAGTGPRGQQLYAASWYREPTATELSFYMPKGVIGWGEVGCRTVARYHVEDCVLLGESPRGSGLANAVSQAAWQFLVRPPRINGRSMVGEWVRIRIDLTDKGDVLLR